MVILRLSSPFSCPFQMIFVIFKPAVLWFCACMLKIRYSFQPVFMSFLQFPRIFSNFLNWILLSRCNKTRKFIYVCSDSSEFTYICRIVLCISVKLAKILPYETFIFQWICIVTNVIKKSMILLEEKQVTATRKHLALYYQDPESRKEANVYGHPRRVKPDG